MGACTTTPGKLMICSELLVNDLETLLFDEGLPLPLLLRMKMARDAALGLLWLHSCNPAIVHRDLKSSNLLVDEHYRVKVCDFGLSQLKPRGEALSDSAESGAKGTPLWMSPEILSGKEFTEKADVYSYGLVLWQILTREELFPEMDNLQVFAQAICRRNLRPQIPSDAPPKLAALIRRCWAPSPASRPGFGDVITALDDIIAEIAVPDAAARAWWVGAFGGPAETVSWREFLNGYASATGLVSRGVLAHDALVFAPATLPEGAEVALRCFKALLADEKDLVSITKFGSALAWFGSFARDGAQIPFRLRDLAQQPYFHGDVGTNDAEERLSEKPQGTFLLRFSSSEAGAFTISKVSPFGAITHQRVQHPPGKSEYTVNGSTYSSIEELVEAERGALNLIMPCPGSRFLPLFARMSVQGYV